MGLRERALRLVTAAAVSLAVSPALAFVDGETLHLECEAGNSVGYVLGVLDAYEALDATRICMPRGLKGVEANKTVCGFLADYPDQRELPAETLVISAMAIKWPCDAPF